MSETPINKVDSNKTLYIMIGIVVVVVIGLFTNGFGLFDRSPTEATSRSEEVEFVPLAIGAAPVLGNADAPVTIYEFSDFSCPYCAAAAGFNQRIIDTLKRSDENWEPPLITLKEEYIQTGKAKLVFKYSPGHGSGQPAHHVGWCLNDQGLFWQFHDLAFNQQENTDDLVTMKSLAAQVGANMTLVEACLSSNKYYELFERDTAMGRSNGVSGTPSFFVNGKLLGGAVSASELASAIEKELA